MPAGRTSPRLLAAALVVIGVVTATPALALAEPEVLEWTYGVSDPDPMSLALLQHRGMLQLALGGALVWAAFFPPARVAALAGALVTKSTFLALLVPRAELRADVAAFSVVFDALCIALFAVFLVVTAVRGRRRADVR
ncbi:hypothetical protein [Nocardioides sp.]|uniref:hypothetical protein n=1 Tax=Nocardioides sp. TaxID=35761 RepID=UPI001A18C86D|nr:hypothetical protein [Nocardioides sp.]MBJ7355731.1 hypothetical protein [Nocardioides sp.]